MKFHFKNQNTHGEIILIIGEKGFDRDFFRRDRAHKYLTIAWNRGETQKIVVDEIEYDFPENSILPLMVNQSFRFENAETITAWQFNRDFYCIVDNDREVGCVGFLFYGLANTNFITLSEKDIKKINLLLEVFRDEFSEQDDTQREMLRILLVRLIIILTRIAKAGYSNEKLFEANKFDIIRQFNLMVENHFKVEHEVRFYAAKLNKSPKTLSNYFALYSHKTPLQIIQERITLEAKRLFYYTDKSSKEIAYELGFDDPSHFSRFFKNQTSQTPKQFKAASGNT